MSTSLQRACTWSGPIFLAMFFGGFIIAGWLPPPSANRSAAQVAAEYLHHTDRIRLGALVIGAASVAQGVWTALMSVQLRRIEGDRPMLTYLQLAAGGVGILVVIIPAFVFTAAAFEPTRDPQITQALHDLGWLCLVGMGWPALLQALSVALATFTDRSSAPVFPRWFGWWNLWASLAFAGGPFVVFFHTGPYAWDGAVSFWTAGVLFGAWFGAWFIVLRRAIAAEEAAA